MCTTSETPSPIKVLMAEVESKGYSPLKFSLHRTLTKADKEILDQANQKAHHKRKILAHKGYSDMNIGQINHRDNFMSSRNVASPSGSKKLFSFLNSSKDVPNGGSSIDNEQNFHMQQNYNKEEVKNLENPIMSKILERPQVKSPDTSISWSREMSVLSDRHKNKHRNHTHKIHKLGTKGSGHFSPTNIKSFKPVELCKGSINLRVKSPQVYMHKRQKNNKRTFSNEEFDIKSLIS